MVNLEWNYQKGGKGGHWLKKEEKEDTFREKGGKVGAFTYQKKGE